MSKNDSPLEFEEACILADYLSLKGLTFSHIAQETYTKSWNQKRKNKLQGVRRGVPDYLIVINNTLLFLELKRLKGGVVSAEQKDWVEKLGACDGTRAVVCRGAQEAIDIIESYDEK